MVLDRTIIEIRVSIPDKDITICTSAPIIRGWYSRPVVATVPKVPLNKLKNNILNLKREFKLPTNIMIIIPSFVEIYKLMSI
jgi:hypothetical protein